MESPEEKMTETPPGRAGKCLYEVLTHANELSVLIFPAMHGRLERCVNGEPLQLARNGRVSVLVLHRRALKEGL